MRPTCISDICAHLYDIRACIRRYALYQEARHDENVLILKQN